VSEEFENPSEHVEHAEHARHDAVKGDNLTRDVAVMVAIMTIVATIIGSFVDVEATHASSLKNEAVLVQAQASDQWGFFQAKSTKKNAYQIAAEEAAAAGHDPDRFAEKARKYGEEEEAIQEKAKGLEERSGDLWKESDHHTHRQHTLNYAEILVHVATVLCSLTIFIRRRFVLKAAVAMAAAGAAVAVWTLVA
jgi:hypothetical protein